MRLIEELFQHYQIDLVLDTKAGDVYAFGVEGVGEVKIHQDTKGWVHLMTEVANPTRDCAHDIARFNTFNLAHPQLVLGLNPDDRAVVLHSRLPAFELNRVRLIEFFEHFCAQARVLAVHFN